MLKDFYFNDDFRNKKCNLLSKKIVSLSKFSFSSNFSDPFSDCMKSAMGKTRNDEVGLLIKQIYS